MTTPPAADTIDPTLLPEISASPITSYDIDADVVATAVRHGIAAAEPGLIGEYGRTYLIPDGYKLQTLDDRDMSDPKLPPHRAGQFRFVGIESIGLYVNRYKTADTLGYITDVNGRGPALLTGDVPIAEYVLDDHPVDNTAHRAHTAKLILRPTAAARRWGAALTAATLDQEALLDLVVDGIGEIASPDGATLRDLVADLHAIRTTSARSVIRTGGQATVEVSDNVTLHGGTGNTVTVPESITIVLQPYAGIDETIVVPVTIKPRITTGEKVQFRLEAPGLDDQISTTIGTIRAQLDEFTEITPLWVP